MILDINFSQARELEGIHFDVFFIDVREVDEWKQGHLEGAECVPLSLLPHVYSERLSDKNAAYVVYCRSGGRSKQAALLLESLGYTNLYNLEGGIEGVSSEYIVL